MSYETGEFPEPLSLQRERRLRQAMAFVMTACASFLLIALMWPLSVSGFRSQTRIAVRVGETAGAQQEFQNLLAAAIRQQTTDDELKSLAETVAQRIEVTNADFKTIDVEKIKRSISVRALPGTTLDTMQVDFGFAGNGTSDEKVFVQLLTDELSRSMLSIADGSDLDSSLAIESVSGTELRQQVDQLQWLVSQIENDLSEVKNAIEAIPNGTQPNNPFRSASHSSNLPNHSDADSTAAMTEIRDAISAIDIATIRQQLNHLQTISESMVAPPNNFGSAEQSLTGTPRSVVTSIRTVPIGGLPDRSQLVLIGIFSAVVGSVVAVNYSAFADRGFANVSRIVTRLGLPVVATLPADRNGVMNREQPKLPLANRVVHVAKLLLLAIVVLALGFCLINSEVRAAFIENPFYGFSRIAWVLTGH